MTITAAELRHQRRRTAAFHIKLRLDKEREEDMLTAKEHRALLGNIPDPVKTYSPEAFNQMELRLWNAIRVRMDYTDWRFACSPGPEMRAHPGQAQAVKLFDKAIARNGIEEGDYIPPGVSRVPAGPRTHIDRTVSPTDPGFSAE